MLFVMHITFRSNGDTVYLWISSSEYEGRLHMYICSELNFYKK